MASSFSLDFLFDFLPGLEGFPPSIFDPLVAKMNRSIVDHPHINGVVVVSSSSQPLVYTRKWQDFEKVKEVADLLTSFGLDYLLKNLGHRSYHGTEVITFPDFSAGLVRLTDSEVLAVLTSGEPQITTSSYISTVANSLRSNLMEPSEDRINSLPNPKLNKSPSSSIPEPTSKS